MPFTISHAAVVMPFSRPLARWRLLSAAIIGSMVPDFRIFLPWHLQRFETHSFMALWTFCLPVGMVTYWLFQLLIKTPVLVVMPESAYARWHSFASPARVDSLKQWLLAASGVLIGAVTHLVLDAFTHEGARGVRLLPLLDESLSEGRHHVPVFYVLQDLGSLIGLIAVLLMVLYGLRPSKRPHVANRALQPAERRWWLAAYIVAALLLSLACYALAWSPAHLHPLIFWALNDGAIAGLRGMASALILVSLALDLRLRGRAQPRA